MVNLVERRWGDRIQRFGANCVASNQMIVTVTEECVGDYRAGTATRIDEQFPVCLWQVPPGRAFENIVSQYVLFAR